MEREFCMRENMQEEGNEYEVLLSAPSSVTVWSSQDRCYHSLLQITGALYSADENNP